MSFELFSQEKIVNHQENHSPTKDFSDSLYNFPKMGEGAKIGIGYGKKTDFTKKPLITEIVGIKRDFDIDAKPRGAIYSFGQSRDKFAKA